MQHMLRMICKSRTYQSSIVTNKWNAGRRHQLFARDRPPPAGRGAVRHDPARHRLGQPLAGRAGRFSRGAVARRWLDAAQRVLRSLRPSGPRKLVRVRAVQRHDARPRDDAGQRTDDRRGDRRQGQRDRRSSWPAQPDDAKVVDELFVRFLSRPASPAEIEAGVKALHAGRQRAGPIGGGTVGPRSPARRPNKPSGKPRQAPPAWTMLEPAEMKSSIGRHLRQAARSVGAGRRGQWQGTYTIVLSTDAADVTAIRLELLADAKLPGGRTGSGPQRQPDALRDSRHGGLQSRSVEVDAALIQPRHGRFQPGQLHRGQRHRRQPAIALGHQSRRSARTTRRRSRSRKT